MPRRKNAPAADTAPTIADAVQERVAAGPSVAGNPSGTADPFSPAPFADRHPMETIVLGLAND